MDDLEFKIAHMPLAPGDVLVVKVKGLITQEQGRRIELQARDKLPPDIKVIVIDQSIDLAVLTRAEIEART